MAHPSLRALGTLLWEVVAVGVCSLVVAVGIGYVQGLLSFRGDVVLGFQGAATGLLLGPITGWGCYFAIFRASQRTLTADLFAKIVSLSALTGVLLGFCAMVIEPGLSFPLSFFMPFAALMWASLFDTDTPMRNRTLNVISRNSLFAILGFGIGTIQGIFAYTGVESDSTMLFGGAVGVLGVLFVAQLRWRDVDRDPTFLRLCGMVTVATLVGAVACFGLSVLTEGTKGWAGLFVAPGVLLFTSRNRGGPEVSQK